MKKADLRRIATSSGAKVVTSLASMEDDQEESFDSASLGECEKVYEDRVGDWDYMFFEGMK